MALKLNSSSGGSVTLQEPTTASNYTLTVPAQTGTVVATDASGNVGIGVTPSAWTSTYSQRAIQVGPVGSFSSLSASSSNNQTFLMSNAYDNLALKYINSDYATRYVQYAGNHIWQNAPSGTAGANVTFTDRMTLDSSGNLLVNQTSINGTGGKINVTFAGGSEYGIKLKSSVSGSGAMAQFNNSANTEVGTITTTNTATAYNTSSDYRLKENVAPMIGALATVSALKPVTYTWKADGSDGQGFIAHELQAVVPDCVTGEKDAVDADGNPVYQGIDTSFLVATLTAAIQEQQAIITSQASAITALEARLTALENK